MDADGDSQTNLTDNAQVDLEPSWSPDGSRIAFVSDRGRHRQVYVMDADGGKPNPPDQQRSREHWARLVSGRQQDRLQLLPGRQQ